METERPLRHLLELWRWRAASSWWQTCSDSLGSAAPLSHQSPLIFTPEWKEERVRKWAEISLEKLHGLQENEKKEEVGENMEERGRSTVGLASSV